MSRRTIQAIWNKIGIAAPWLVALSLIAFLAPELRQQRWQDSQTLSQPSGEVGAARLAQVNPTNFFFVQGELILTGSRPGIAAALQALSTIGVGAEQIR